jgi:membrane protease YdiL (CAAX protease family)
MKALFTKKPIASFILLTFVITYVLGFLPLFIHLPKDIGMGFGFLSGSGPLISAFIIMSVNSNTRLKVGSLPIFLIVFLAAGISLVLWLLYTGKGLPNINNRMPMLNEVSLAGFMVFLTMLLVIALNASNATNVRMKDNYLRSFLVKKEKLNWYITAFLLFPSLALTSFFIGNAIGIQTTKYFINPDMFWFVSFFSAFLFAGGNEEFGWRGFLQKELQKKYNPLITSFGIWLLWTIWHLPLYYNGFKSTIGISGILPQLIYLAPLTVIFTWIYNKSGYSILAVILLHAMNNTFDGVFGHSRSVLFALLCLFSIYCVVDNKMWKKKDEYKQNLQDAY